MKVPNELLFKEPVKIPALRSSEIAECGLVCMAMIGNFYGHNLDLNAVRNLFPLSGSGMDLKSLINCGERLSLISRVVKAEINQLRFVQIPAVLHWDMNHFVVLVNVSKIGITINDPLRGRLKLTWAEVSSHFTGIVIEFSPISTFIPKTDVQNVKLSTLYSNITGLKSSFTLIIALTIAVQLIAFAAPFQMQLVVDSAIAGFDLDLLSIIVFVFLSLFLLQICISVIRDFSIQLFSSQLVFQMVRNVFHHLIRLPMAYFEKRHVGDVISRMSSTKIIQDTMVRGVSVTVIDGFMSIASFLIMVLYAPYLSLVIVISLFILIFVNIIYYKYAKVKSENVVLTAANEQSHLIETIRATTTIKLMAKEAEREVDWQNLYVRNFNAVINFQKFSTLHTSIQGLITGIQFSAIVYLAAKDVITGSGFTIGMLTTYLAFRQTFMERFQSFLNQIVQFRMLKVHIDRLSDIIIAQPEYRTAEEINFVPEGNIHFDNVNFKYGEVDKTILNDVNFHIDSEDFVAIIGPSGHGKTTLIKLILGLYTPTSGTIRVNGRILLPDILKGWRSGLGVVLQDDRLLSGTIADNICFFDPNVKLENVYRAATLAEINTDILKMPMKYHTLVGDMGSTLSGGQKQRILLARALYREPKILVLDEGTANLDPKTEEAIADTIQKLPITRIVVAHRPALIKRAMKCVRVEEGRVEVISHH